MNEREHIDRLDQRRGYLAGRIKLKAERGWETVYDQSEHDALAWALDQLQARDNPLRPEYR